ncbi:MAG: hypothetical protein OEZ58_22040 [Gammaproteobacteria bacterium]|nr:hypothetical protein [Gammaproteobacteria bacterium]MDH5731673.1 hypothetical protein [Gammaproteobacteria bacterium]
MKMKLLVFTFFLSVSFTSSHAIEPAYYINELNFSLVSTHYEKLLRVVSQADEFEALLAVNAIGNMLVSKAPELKKEALNYVSYLLIKHPKLMVTWLAGDEDAYLSFQNGIQNKFYIYEDRVKEREKLRNDVIASLTRHVDEQKESFLKDKAKEILRIYKQTKIQIKPDL